MASIVLLTETPFSTDLRPSRVPGFRFAFRNPHPLLRATNIVEDEKIAARCHPISSTTCSATSKPKSNKKATWLGLYAQNFAREVCTSLSNLCMVHIDDKIMCRDFLAIRHTIPC
jgi:hypothetical protein